MSTSITQDMKYRQSLMNYVEKYGVSQGSRKYKKADHIYLFLENTVGRNDSGIPTIRREMAAYGLPEPVFQNRRNEFVVTLYNRSQSKVQTGTVIHQEANDLIAFCKTPRTRKEIADYLGIQVSAYLMKKHIRPLLDAGALKMMLPDKPKSKNQKYYA